MKDEAPQDKSSPLIKTDQESLRNYYEWLRQVHSSGMCELLSATNVLRLRR
jgi:hypothetical protein